MKKSYSFFCLLVTLVFFFSISSLPVSAESGSGVGFIEYQTEASINFEEVIEVILTNKETGHYYTQKLYRINDYSANTSIPVGDYSITARVLNDADLLLTDYSVACLSEEVSVKNLHSAAVVSLRVDEFASGDVSGDTHPYFEENVIGTEPTGTDETIAPEQESTGSITEQQTPLEQEKEGRSIVVSIVVTILVLIVIALVLFSIKNKQES